MLKFTKMQGLGNDYVYVDCTKSGIPENVVDLARFVSDRNFGIGSDGLILICESKTCDFQMRMFNKDGSEAAMCGNGIRCVGKFVYDKGLTNKKRIMVETLAGVKELELNVEDEKVKTVKVDMGEPIWEADKIPVVGSKIDGKKRVENLKINALDKAFEVSCVSMGNPHAITIVEKVEEFEVEKYGKILETDVHFPKKANIEFIEIKDPKTIKMRVWERGTGQTNACGTGACAVMAVCHQKGMVEDTVTVELLGGNLMIEWNKKNHHIYMTGPAETVFEGEIDWKGRKK